ncbi:MAG TPA: hypothetical protein VJQ56_10280 [Blastocatellia bacterium]|nr:hypothetical protein [Blastocatellia bacterium]
MESTNGKNRRSGVERRKADRRNPDRAPEAGVLTTRTGERRKRTRRAADTRTSKKPSK